MSSDSKMFDAYQIIERQGVDKKSIFIRIGIAHLNKDNSINLYLDALPLDGKVHIREKLFKPKRKEES